MKATIATLLCLGMAAAAPQQRKGKALSEVLQDLDLETLDCQIGKCKQENYFGTWKPMFPNPKEMFKSIGCKFSLEYNIQTNKNRPRWIDIVENCGIKEKAQTLSTTYKFEKGTFPAPILSIDDMITVEFERMFTLEGNVVAAVVKHPLMIYSRKKELKMVQSLWVYQPLGGPRPRLTERQAERLGQSI